MFFYKVPIFIGVISNPIIYGVTNIMYREAYKELLLSVFKVFHKKEDISQPTSVELQS